MAAALINVPAKAKRGDIIEIKTLMSHIMETGYRRTTTGEVIPRDIITSFSCRYNGEEIFRADFSPAIAANPFLTFFTVATVKKVMNGLAAIAGNRSARKISSPL